MTGAVTNLQQQLDVIAAAMAAEADRGRVADYIPALGRVGADQFAIAVVTADGTCVSAGDARTPFSIQSISKVFTLTLALGRVGAGLWQRVGREPSGSAFNSIVQLESEQGIPRNPFINAGAIAVADVLVAGSDAATQSGVLLDFVRRLAGDDADGDERIVIDAEVAESEAATGHRNSALAHFMKSYGTVATVGPALRLYFNACAIAMNVRQLAHAGRYLMHGGVQPGTGARMLSEQQARRVSALMLTCGHYDGSGEFAFRVGIPGKSGVGGGILAIVPGVASIAAWSPGLNERGNSKLASVALERLSEAMNWSLFTPQT